MDIKVKISPKEWAEKVFQIRLAEIANPSLNTFSGLGRCYELISECGFVLDEEAEEPKPRPICTTHCPDTNGVCLICGETVYALLNESKDLEPEPTPQRSEKWLECEKYLKMLPDGYRERALSQIDEEFLVKSQIVFCIEDAVLWFCNWYTTKEDWNFWNKVYKHYYKGESLPPLPNN